GSFVVIHAGGVDIVGPKINLNGGGSPGEVVLPISVTEIGTYNLYFVLINENNGKPLAYFPYDIELGSGIKITGVTDEEGNTEVMVSDKEEIAKIHVYEPDVTPINPEWDA
ncbi:TPA: hypothetical protein O7X39_004517, partial [Salmonella enterica]|nr:hypothetical protein [Salmonella enterica]